MTLAELIAQHCADLGQDYPAIATRLNAATTIVNPVTVAPQIPSHITLKGLLSLVPPAEGAKVFGIPSFVDNLKVAVDAQDRDYLGYLLQVALAAGAISQQTAGLLAPILSATEADPSWTATIAGPSLAAANGFGVVTPMDVQAALN